MTTKVEKAVETFSKGFNCAQAVFSTYAPELGIEEHEALKISAGFGSGMSRLQEVCGAVTGAFMAIGAKLGNIETADTAAKGKTYEQVRSFDKQFRELHGTILCRELLGCDLNTEEGQRQFTEKNLIKTVCTECVRDAARIVEETALKE
jgi:C_GCAxxG_C_C family probable redox protein